MLTVCVTLHRHELRNQKKKKKKGEVVVLDGLRLEVFSEKINEERKEGKLAQLKPQLKACVKGWQCQRAIALFVF